VTIGFITHRAELKAERRNPRRTGFCGTNLSGPSSVPCSSVASGTAAPGATTAG
jgi:hypothetical protein